MLESLRVLLSRWKLSPKFKERPLEKTSCFKSRELKKRIIAPRLWKSAGGRSAPRAAGTGGTRARVQGAAVRTRAVHVRARDQRRGPRRAAAAAVVRRALARRRAAPRDESPPAHAQKRARGTRETRLPARARHAARLSLQRDRVPAPTARRLAKTASQPGAGRVSHPSSSSSSSSSRIFEARSVCGSG